MAIHLIKRPAELGLPVQWAVWSDNEKDEPELGRCIAINEHKIVALAYAVAELNSDMQELLKIINNLSKNPEGIYIEDNQHEQSPGSAGPSSNL